MRILALSIILFSCFQLLAQDDKCTVSQAIESGSDCRELVIYASDVDLSLADVNMDKLKSFKSVEVRGVIGTERLNNLVGFFDQLNSLTLNNNGLLELTLPETDQLKSLRIIDNPDIDNNLWGKVFRSVPNLEDLYISSSNIESLPQLKYLKQLKSLSIERSTNLNLESLISTLEKLEYLKSLSLSVNSLTELPKSIGNLDQLEVLDISNNNLTELPRNMGRMDALSRVKIETNIIINPVDEYGKLGKLNINYLSVDGDISEAEKEKIDKIFPKAVIDYELDTIPEDEILEVKEEMDTTSRGEIYTSEGDFRVLSNAYLSYNAIFRPSNISIDTLLFDEKYEDFTYVRKVKKRLYSPYNLDDQGRYQTFNFWGRMVSRKPNHSQSIIKLSLLPKRKTARKEVWITIKSDRKEYRELNAFNGFVWKVEGVSRKQFKRDYIKRKLYSDLRISYDGSSEVFDLELKSPDSLLNLSARPRPKGKKASIDIAVKNYEKRMQRYNKTLNKVRDKHDKGVLVRAEQNRKDKKANEVSNWETLRQLMGSEEKELSNKEWIDYYTKVISNERIALDNAPLVMISLMRSFSIDGYLKLNTNSWRLDRGETTRDLQPTDILTFECFDEDSGKLAVSQFMVLNKNNKTIQMYNGTSGIDKEAFRLTIGEEIVIIGRLVNGNFFVVSENSIQTVIAQNQNIVKFYPKVYDASFSTIGQLRLENNLMP